MAKRDKKRFVNGDNGGADQSGAFQAEANAPGREERTRERAYQLYVERGSIPGHEVEDWLRAESEQQEALSATQSDSEIAPRSNGQMSGFRLDSTAPSTAREHRSNDFS